ncbi:MAG: NADH-quinone oxidoreductase subunit A [bacterium]|nr:NADH-quinone oxidoreductase subunit A [bacterium]
MTIGAISIFIFFLVGIGMAAVPVLLSFLLWYGKKKKVIYELRVTSREFEPYESGMTAEGPGRLVGFEYLIYAVLFLLFDAVALLLLLGAIAVKQDRSTYLLPYFLLAALALLIVAYGAKKRAYLNI